MSVGTFHSSKESLTQTITRDFFYNRSLQQLGLELSLGEFADDIRADVRLVGGALLHQQAVATQRHERAAGATTAAVERQTAEVVQLREEQAQQARDLQHAVEDSARVLTKSIDATTSAVAHLEGAIVDQLTHVRWALAEQHETLRGIFQTLRESRSNECRQLVAQGEENLRAKYYPEAEERLKLALTYDNVDHLVHQNLGLVSVHLGKPEVALAHFQKALAFPPKLEAQHSTSKPFFLARAATHAARVLYAAERYDEAAKYLETALTHDPTAAKNWYDLAVVEAYRGNAEAACTALTRAVASEPAYYGQALADTELDPVRAAVDALLLHLRDEKRTEVATLPATLDLLDQVVADVRDATGVNRGPVAVPAATMPGHLRSRLAAAKERDTFVAYQGILDAVRELSTNLPKQLVAALDDATERDRARHARALSGQRARSAPEEQRLQQEFEAVAAKRRGNGIVAVQLAGWFVIVGLGVGIGLQVGGCLGAVLGLLLGTGASKAFWHLLEVRQDRAFAAKQKAAFQEVERCRVAVRAPAADLTAAHDRDAARLKTLREKVLKTLPAAAQ